MLDELLIEKMIRLWKDAQKDTEWKKGVRLIIQQRIAVQQKILQFLLRYVIGATTATEFGASLERNAPTAWDLFGLPGDSGSTVLSQFVMRLADESFVAANLTHLLAAPSSEGDSRTKIHELAAFVRHHAGGLFLEEHAPFFLSVWWHIQAPDHWPIFSNSARKVLQDQGLYHMQNDIAEDYLEFRSIFLELSCDLNMDPWQCELFLSRLGNDAGPSRVSAPRTQAMPRQHILSDHQNATTQHTQAQWLLGSLGRKLGCSVWIARSDHQRAWKNQELRTLSIDSFPSLGLGQSSERIIQLIDVVWLKDNQVQAAFDVESSRSVYPGLLHLSDLAASTPTMNFPLFIVAPSARGQTMQRELSRPTFQLLELDKRCGYIELEQLISQFPTFQRWAEKPSAITQLSSWFPKIHL